MKKLLLSSVAAILLAFGGSAQAALVMDVYKGAGLGGVAGVQNAIKNSTPTYSGIATTVDYWNGIDGSGNHAGGSAFPEGLLDDFGVHFHGFLNVTTAGVYGFRSNADDGVQLLIDGKEVFTKDRYAFPENTSLSVDLSAGVHTIDFIYFQGPNGATVELDSKKDSWTGSSADFRLLGSSGSGLETLTTIPEPTSLALFGVAFAGLAAARRRQTKI